MLTVEEALASILASVQPLPPMRFSLHEALGRVLAEPIYSDIDLPPFDNSAVDGFAVRAAETIGASVDSPILFREIESVSAGEVPTEAITSGTCARVMTGAPIPPGADAMVMREDAEESARGIRIRVSAERREHIRYRGESLRSGALVLKAGHRIGPAETGILATVGAVQPLCYGYPRVAVFSTGDELIDPAEIPVGGKIRDSNRCILAALVRETGSELAIHSHLPDNLGSTVSALRAAVGFDGAERADVIITSGGVSVGDRDFVRPAVESIGSLDLWRVNMKPGKPVAFGRIPSGSGGEALFFGLPGNPVSTMVTFELFVRPALWALSGRRDLARPRINVRLAAPVDHKPGRREFVRAVAVLSANGWVASPTGAQGSANLGSMLSANALIDIPEDSGSLSAGDVATAHMIGVPAVDEGDDRA